MSCLLLRWGSHSTCCRVVHPAYFLVSCSAVWPTSAPYPPLVIQQTSAPDSQSIPVDLQPFLQLGVHFTFTNVQSLCQPPESPHPHLQVILHSGCDTPGLYPEGNCLRLALFFCSLLLCLHIPAGASVRLFIPC